MLVIHSALDERCVFVGRHVATAAGGGQKTLSFHTGHQLLRALNRLLCRGNLLLG